MCVFCSTRTCMLLGFDGCLAFYSMLKTFSWAKGENPQHAQQIEKWRPNPNFGWISEGSTCLFEITAPFLRSGGSFRYSSLKGSRNTGFFCPRAFWQWVVLGIPFSRRTHRCHTIYLRSPRPSEQPIRTALTTWPHKRPRRSMHQSAETMR